MQPWPKEGPNLSRARQITGKSLAARHSLVMLLIRGEASPARPRRAVAFQNAHGEPPRAPPVRTLGTLPFDVCSTTARLGQ